MIVVVVFVSDVLVVLVCLCLFCLCLVVFVCFCLRSFVCQCVGVVRVACFRLLLFGVGCVRLCCWLLMFLVIYIYIYIYCFCLVCFVCFQSNWYYECLIGVGCCWCCLCFCFCCMYLPGWNCSCYALFYCSLMLIVLCVWLVLFVLFVR